MLVVRQLISESVQFGLKQVLAETHRLIAAEEGVYAFTNRQLGPADDMFAYCHSCSDSMFPTVTEALYLALRMADELERGGSWGSSFAGRFAREATEILAQERVGWELIDGHMVEIRSRELHIAVVEPTLLLLHQSRFGSAERAYEQALEELAHGKAWDAITDAGRALQEVLTRLGCDGNQLGDLIRSARKRGLFAAHDAQLTDAVEKVMHWVSADRSQMGDAHHETSATRDDAWLIVHVVGALIVRLAASTPRG